MLKYNRLGALSGLSRTRNLVMVTVLAAIATGCATTDQAVVKTPPATQIAKPVLDPRVLEFAKKAVADGRYADARTILQRVFLAEAENIQAKLLAAEVTLATGKAEHAEALFDAIASDPAVEARALQGKGLALIKLGESEKGIEVLQQAVKKNSGLWRGWNALAYQYDIEGQWQKSTKAYDQAINGSPKTAFLYNNRGFSRLLQKNTDAAIKDLRTAVRLDPKLKVARHNLRLALAWKGQYDRAMLGVVKDQQGTALNNVGFVALLRGDFPTAEAYFLRALEADAAYHQIAHKNLSYLRSLKKVRDSEDNPKRANRS